MKRHRNFPSLHHLLFSSVSDQQCPHPKQGPPGSPCCLPFTQCPRGWGLGVDGAAAAQLAPAWSCSSPRHRAHVGKLAGHSFPRAVREFTDGLLTRRCQIIKTVPGINYINFFREISWSSLRFQMVHLKLCLFLKKGEV